MFAHRAGLRPKNGLAQKKSPKSGRDELPLIRRFWTRRIRAQQVENRDGGGKVAPDVGRVDGIIREEPKDPLRPPLSGRISATPDPGLKPWAVLYSRFAAKPPSFFGTRTPGACPHFRLHIKPLSRSRGQGRKAWGQLQKVQGHGRGNSCERPDLDHFAVRSNKRDLELVPTEAISRLIRCRPYLRLGGERRGVNKKPL